MSFFTNLPWRKVFIATLSGVVLLVVGGAIRHTTADWFGEGFGVGGVRTALASHEADASVHPNAALLEQRFQGIEDKVENLEEALKETEKELKQDSKDNTQRIIDALQNRSN